MARISRWPGLKHFENVTTKDINDGQSWLDIEKVSVSSYHCISRWNNKIPQGILPCIVQLLPRNSSLVHAIRAHLCFRMIMGLHCVSDEQIARKEKYQVDYGSWCSVRFDTP